MSSQGTGPADEPSTEPPRPLSIGDELPSIRTPPMDRMRLAYMAVAMRDPNPVHLDDDFAQGIGLPGVIAHGTFAVSYVGAAISRHVGVDRIRTFNVELTAPVFIGDELTTQVTTGMVHSMGDETILEGVLSVRNQDGTLVARGSASWISP